jgi:hypothetical protein
MKNVLIFFFVVLAVSSFELETLEETLEKRHRPSPLCPDNCNTVSFDNCNYCDCSNPRTPVCTKISCEANTIVPRYCVYTRVIREKCPSCCSVYNNGCQECLCKKDRNGYYMICDNRVCITQGIPFCQECTFPKVWNECGSPCPLTCDNQSPICIEKCVPRCECPSDRPFELLCPRGNCLCNSSKECLDLDLDFDSDSD